MLRLHRRFVLLGKVDLVHRSVQVLVQIKNHECFAAIDDKELAQASLN